MSLPAVWGDLMKHASFPQSRRKIGSILVLVVLASCSGARSSSGLPPVTSLANGSQTASNASAPVGSFDQTLGFKNLTDLGPAAPDQNVHLLVTLAHRNEAGLQQLIADQSKRGPGAHTEFLTPRQFDSQFGASPETRARIQEALRSGGFKVDVDRFGASVVEADGSVVTAEKYFSTKIHNVRGPSGRVALLPDAPPVTPVALQSDVVSILGLDTTDINLPKKRVSGIRPAIYCPQTIGNCPGPGPNPTDPPNPTPPPPTPPPPPPPAGCSGSSQPLVPPSGYTDDTTFFASGRTGYAPYTYAYDYDLPVQHGYAGCSAYPIAIIIDSDVFDTDLQQFYSAMGVNRTGNLIRLGSGNITADGWLEATLDVETVSALAPNADVYLYRIPSLSFNDIVAGMNSVVQDNLAAVLSMSLAGCEKQPWPSLYEAASAEDSVAAQASAQGITVVAASGDSGGPSYLSGCSSVMAPAASPNIVAVGGTSPYTDGGYPYHAYRMDPSGAGWQYAWGETVQGAGPPCASNFCATGGGASTHFQTGEQLAACSDSWRCVPDVSFAADVNYYGYMVIQGGPSSAAGTSFATPIFAAMQAEIDERQGTRKGNVVGRLYSLWRTYGYGAAPDGSPFIFHDITQGNTGWSAGSGYDWASGIGSVDGWALSSAE